MLAVWLSCVLGVGGKVEHVFPRLCVIVQGRWVRVEYPSASVGFRDGVIVEWVLGPGYRMMDFGALPYLVS